jgi:Ca-activated chloride channel homolog
VFGRRAIPVSLALTALACPAFAQTGRELVAQGNAKFAAGDFEAAVALYQKAQEATNPPTAAALHNEGCVLLEQGKPAEAAERFRAAEAASADPEVSARARFNLGQALFRQGGAAEKEHPEQTLDLLRQSAAAFRSVLDVAPDDAEAARHVEIARRRMKHLEDRRREEQQKQQSQGAGQKQDRPNQAQQSDQPPSEEQQQADRLKDLAERQRQAAGESQKAQQSGADQQKLDELQNKQEEISKDTSAAKDEQEEQDQGAPSEQLTRAGEEQRHAEEELRKQNPGAAREHQERAAKLLEQAAKKAQEKADRANEGGRQGKGQEPSDQKEPGKAQGQSKQMGDSAPRQEQNYDKTAAALLDRERQRRQERMPAVRAARGTGAPVEKDW